MGQPIFRSVDGSMWEILGGVARELSPERSAEVLARVGTAGIEARMARGLSVLSHFRLTELSDDAPVTAERPYAALRSE